jgi:hypothetical protein
MAKVFCYLIAGLPADTFLLLRLWIAAACLIYFGHSFRKSALIERADQAPSKHVGPGREADAGDPISATGACR